MSIWCGVGIRIGDVNMIGMGLGRWWEERGAGCVWYFLYRRGGKVVAIPRDAQDGVLIWVVTRMCGLLAICWWVERYWCVCGWQMERRCSATWIEWVLLWFSFPFFLAFVPRNEERSMCHEVWLFARLISRHGYASGCMGGGRVVCAIMIVVVPRLSLLWLVSL